MCIQFHDIWFNGRAFFVFSFFFFLPPPGFVSSGTSMEQIHPLIAFSLLTLIIFVLFGGNERCFLFLSNDFKQFEQPVVCNHANRIQIQTQIYKGIMYMFDHMPLWSEVVGLRGKCRKHDNLCSSFGT